MRSFFYSPFPYNNNEMAASKQQQQEQQPRVSWPKYPMNEDTFDNYVKRHKLYPVMITGQQTVTYKEFILNYAPAIRNAVEKPMPGGKPLFIMGAAKGVDNYAAHFLKASLDYPYVVIFDKHDKNGDEAIAKGWGLRNGFENYNKRDDAMIKLAKKIIIYLFKDALGSGTYFNLLKWLQYHVPASFLGSESFASLFFSFGRILDRSSEWASSDWKLDETKAVRSDDDKFQHVVNYILVGGFHGYEPAEGDCICGKCAPKKKQQSDDNNSSAAAASATDSPKKPDSTWKPSVESVRVQARDVYAKIDRSDMPAELSSVLKRLVDTAAKEVEEELADKDVANSDDEIPDLVDSDGEVVNDTSVPSRKEDDCDCAKCAAKREFRR